jgi:HSP20 family molecular chaperone IbpA
MSDTAIEKQQNSVNIPQRVEQTTQYTPLVDIIETADEFWFQADLPGVSAGDVDVSFDNGVLTIEAKASPRQPQGHGYIWQEYGIGHFYRQFSLSAPVEPGQIRAELKNGVLELHVPKAAKAKTRRIEIHSA